MDLLSQYPSYPNPSQSSQSNSHTYGTSPGNNLAGFGSPNTENTSPHQNPVNTEQQPHFSTSEADERQRQFSALKEQQRTLKLLQEQRKREEELKSQNLSNSLLEPSTSYSAHPNISLEKSNESHHSPTLNFSPSPGISGSPSPSNSNSFSYSNNSLLKPNTNVLNSTSEQPQSSGVDPQLFEKLNNFMRSVESKLDSLDRQVQQLNLDFKLNNTKQERSSDLLSGKLRELEDQIRSLKSSQPPPAFPINHGSPSPSISAPSYQSERYRTPTPPPAQPSIDKDEEFAKQLQAELDREANSSAPSANPSPPYPNPSYPNIGGYSSPVTPGGPQMTDDGSSSGGMNSCPICGIQLPVKQLHEHIEFQHFRNENPASMQTQNPDGKSPQQSEGFFSKLFGKKRDDVPPTSGELRPPNYAYGAKPMPVQPIPGQPGSVPTQSGAVVPYGYQAYNPQAPHPQVVYRNVPSGSVPYYNSGMYVPK